jgi:hypothetical protein
MARKLHPQVSNIPDSEDIGDLNRAATVRRQAAWNLSMGERLARVHELCQQVNAIRGAARAR